MADDLRHYEASRIKDIDTQIINIYNDFGLTTDLLAQEFEDVIKKLEEDYKIKPLEQINEFNLQDKLASNAFEQLKFQDFYNKEKNTLDILLRVKDVIVGKMFDYYKFNYDKALKMSEIEKYYLPKDKRVIEIDNLIQKQGWKTEHLKARISALSTEHWHLKDYSYGIKAGY